MAAVNEALSELYIEDEDHDKLRESVDDYDNFDQVEITQCSIDQIITTSSSSMFYSEKVPGRSFLGVDEILRRFCA